MASQGAVAGGLAAGSGCCHRPETGSAPAAGKNDRQCEVGETLKVVNTSRNVKIALPVLFIHAPLGISGLPC